MDTISVEPIEGGWAVRTDAVENPMIFRSGHDAETSARALAVRLARQGEPVRLRLSLRQSGRVVRMVCLPPLNDLEPVRLMTLPDPYDPPHAKA